MKKFAMDTIQYYFPPGLGDAVGPEWAGAGQNSRHYLRTSQEMFPGDCINKLSSSLLESLQEQESKLDL